VVQQFVQQLVGQLRRSCTTLQAAVGQLTTTTLRR